MGADLAEHSRLADDVRLRRHRTARQRGINNGSGYTKPFFLAGTAGLDGTKLAAHLNARNLPGVWFRPAAWTPYVGFWKDRELTGVELIVFDPRRFSAVRTAVEILVAIRDLFPHAIQIESVADSIAIGAPTPSEPRCWAARAPSDARSMELCRRGLRIAAAPLFAL